MERDTCQFGFQKNQKYENPQIYFFKLNVAIKTNWMHLLRDKMQQLFMSIMFIDLPQAGLFPS